MYKTVLSFLLLLVCGHHLLAQQTSSRQAVPTTQVIQGLAYDDWDVTVSTNVRGALRQPNVHPGKPLSSRFVPLGSQWGHPIITYAIASGTDDIAGNDERMGIQAAFALWSANTKLSFVEVCSPAQADIVISWATYGHGDAKSFDGPRGVLAHSYPPETSAGAIAGDIHFDDSEQWSLYPIYLAVELDLVTLAAHEIGHALGLDHTTVRGSLMETTYTGPHRYLGHDDITGIQSIYSACTNQLITGLPVFCGSASYAVPQLPAATMVQWSSSDPTVATIDALSGVSQQTGQGTTTLTAVISSACGSTSISKQVTVGAPLTVDKFSIHGSCFNYEANGPGNGFLVCPGEYITVTPADLPCQPFPVTGVQQWQWTYSGPNGTISSTGAYAFSLYAPAQPRQQGTLTLQVNNGCGWSNVGSMFVESLNTGVGEEPFRLAQVTAYPNPAAESLTLPPGTETVRLFTYQGEEVLLPSHRLRQLSLDVRRVPNGLYQLRLIINGHMVNQQLIIRH